MRLIHNLVKYLPYVYFCWIISGIPLLALISVMPLTNNLIFAISHLFLFFTISYLLRSVLKVFSKIYLRWIDLILLLLITIPLIIRFPVYYPLYDDLSFHIPLSSYVSGYWFDTNYFPMSFGTYLYPLPQVSFNPLIDLLGFRLTLLTVGFCMLTWYLSLCLRFVNLSVYTKKYKYVLFLIFSYLFFFPYSMVTQVSFSVDFLALLFALELLYMYFTNNRSLFILFFVLSLLIKQSTGIFLIIPSIYLFFKMGKLEKPNYHLVFVVIFLTLVFVFKSYAETLNPLAWLYNGFFKSPFYNLDNFKDLAFGPTNLKDAVFWPFIGIFSERFGQGMVPIYLKIFYLPYVCFSLVYSSFVFLRNKMQFVVVFATFLVWSNMGGYSRYLIPFVSVFNIFIIINIFNNKVVIPRISLNLTSMLFALFVVVVCLTSIQSDYAWRPYPTYELKNIFATSYDEYLKLYKEGLKMLGKDTPRIIAKEHENDFSGYSVVMPFWRGQTTFYSYLGFLNGLRVVDAVDESTYDNVVSNTKISVRLKNNLQLGKSERILYVFEEGVERYAKNSYIFKQLNCRLLENATPAKELQNNYYFDNIVRYDCVSKEK